MTSLFKNTNIGLALRKQTHYNNSQNVKHNIKNAKSKFINLNLTLAIDHISDKHA